MLGDEDMKKISKRDFDTFGVLIGVVIGIIMGFLIASKIDNNPDNDNSEEVIKNESIEYVYLLQLGKFTSSQDASLFYSEVLNKNINSVYVVDNNTYFIYSYISTSEDEIMKTKEAYELIGYNGIIKKEYIYNRINMIIDNNNDSANKITFYSEMIECLLNSLNNEPVVINENTLVNPIDIELVSWINMLSSIKSKENKIKIELQAYKMLVEKIK